MVKGVWLIIIAFLLIGIVSASDFGYDNSELPSVGMIEEYMKATGDNVFGTYNFNGGWMNGGLTISDVEIYAQVGYFYNITSLNITHQNLTKLTR